MSEHSVFGGSQAERYLHCPGSVKAVSALPPQVENEHMWGGTCAHRLGELCLKTGERTTEQFVGTRLWANNRPFTVTLDMAEAVQVYLDAVYAEIDKEPGHELYVEQKFEFKIPSAKAGEVFGSNDALVYLPSVRRLVVFDYKHGIGVSVSAEENAQLKFYAAGAALDADWPLSEIELVIVQPRAFDADWNGTVRRWLFDTVDLLDFAADLDSTVALAKSDNAPLTAGPWCKKTFCPNMAVCPARDLYVLEEMRVTDYADVKSVADITKDKLPLPASLDPAKIGDILAGANALSEWLNSINEFVFSQLRAGASIPGFKLVEKVARRKWTGEEEEVAGYLELMHDMPLDLVRPRKLATVTEIERMLKAQGLEKKERDDVMIKFTSKESSGLTIAPMSDRRPAVDAIATDYAGVSFDSLSAE